LREFAWLLVLLPALLASCGTPPSRANGKQVIVIGVDGMDPGFVERHWADLPNLARIRDQGSFSRLATTTPPQSPTAWSTFITGLDAAEHGIFDFVHRDPATLAAASEKFGVPGFESIEACLAASGKLDAALSAIARHAAAVVATSPPRRRTSSILSGSSIK